MFDCELNGVSRGRRSLLLALAAGCLYPAGYFAATNAWLLFYDPEPPHVTLMIPLTPPPPQPPLPPPRRPRAQQAASGGAKSVIAKKALAVAAATPAPPPPTPAAAPTPRPAPAPRRFDEHVDYYVALAKQGPAPHIRIETDFASFQPVIRRFHVEFAIGVGRPGPYTVTFLYSPESGQLHRGRLPAGASARQVQNPLTTPLAAAVADAAHQLSVPQDQIEVYAAYPPELMSALAGRVREAAAASGIDGDCVSVSYLPRGGGFDVEVRPAANCIARNAAVKR